MATAIIQLASDEEFHRLITTGMTGISEINISLNPPDSLLCYAVSLDEELYPEYYSLPLGESKFNNKMITIMGKAKEDCELLLTLVMPKSCIEDEDSKLD